MTAASTRFGNVSPEVFDSTDAEFLAALNWRPGESAGADLKTVGLAWKQQCLEHRSNRTRQSFATLDRALETGAATLPEPLLALRQQTLSSTKARKKDTGSDSNSAETALRELLAHLPANDNSFVTLACLELLLFRADRMSARAVGDLWRWTLSAALRLSEQLVEVEEGDELEQMLDSAQIQQVALTSGLIPWLCGLFFDEVKGAPKLAKSGRQSLTSLLASGTDDSGAPVASVVRCLPDWLALWTDAIVAGQHFDRPLWKDASERRLAGLLKASTAMLAGDLNSEPVQWLALMVPLVTTKSDEPWLAGLAAAAQGGKWKPSDVSKKKETTGWQSDTCSAACLRTSWSPAASRITVLHDRPELSIDMTIAGRRVLNGAWGLEVLNNGQPMALTKEWECCCWYSDKDLDYAEWIAEATGGVKVIRYALLHRHDEYAILADVVKNASPERVDVITRLPLVSDWSSTNIFGTREQRFHGHRQTVRVFPLMLPQDPGLGTSGRVEHSPGEYLLATAASSGGLFSPIVLDWSAKRLNADAEWRELTVSEGGQMDHASGRGFRIAIGKHNLLLMRGLRTITRYRTVLGYQSWNETVIARLNPDGLFDEVLLVEQ